MDHPAKMHHFLAANAPTHTLTIPAEGFHGVCESGFEFLPLEQDLLSRCPLPQ
jgi:hypothetical protein